MSVRDVSYAGLACLFLAPCLWGGNFVVGSLLAKDLPGPWMNLLRWGLALCLLLPFFGRSAWAHRAALLRAWREVALLGALGVAGFNSVLYVALHHASLALAAIAFAVTPFLIMGLAALLDRRWPAPRILLAAVMALGAMVLAQAEALAGDIAPIGVGLVLLSALIWAGYSVALQRVTLPVPPAAAILGQVLAGTLFMLPVAALASPLSLEALSWRAWLGLGYLGLCAGALAFWLWQHGIRAAGALRAGLFMNLVPLSAMALGAVALGETLSPVQSVSTAVILLGIALSLGGPARAPCSDAS